MTSNLCHLTCLPYHGAVSLLTPPPHVPLPPSPPLPPPPTHTHITLYFEKNIGDSVITSLSFHLSVHDAISSVTVSLIFTKFVACLSHLLGSCSVMLISGPKQRVKYDEFCPLLYVLLHHCVQDLKVIYCLPSFMLLLYIIYSAFYSHI